MIYKYVFMYLMQSPFTMVYFSQKCNAMRSQIKPIIDPNFIEEAIVMLKDNGMNYQKVSVMLGVNRQTLTEWYRKYEEDVLSREASKRGIQKDMNKRIDDALRAKELLDNLRSIQSKACKRIDEQVEEAQNLHTVVTVLKEVSALIRETEKKATGDGVDLDDMVKKLNEVADGNQEPERDSEEYPG